MSNIAGMRHTYKRRNEWANWKLDPTVTAETKCPTMEGPACVRCGSTIRYNVPGRGRECVRCRKQWRKETRHKYEPHYSQKERNCPLRHSHGIDRKNYERLSALQNHVCALCGKPEDDSLGRSMCVDHCHETGRFRGLLCGRCNRGLGLLGDTLEALEKAVDYLRNNPWDM